MSIIFYTASAVAVFSTVMVITRLNAIHALLYLVVSLLSVAVIFFSVGAQFVAALEIIIYAGAIMILFIFVVMLLNLGSEAVKKEHEMLSKKMWLIPGLLAAILLIEFFYMVATNSSTNLNSQAVTPKAVGISLFSTYLIGVEIAAIMLTAGVIGAYHLGYKKKESSHRYLQGEFKNE
jgi:NADH-quinone oxidoreductase subunit J